MSVYIACENVDFVWSLKQVLEFDDLWQSGVTDTRELANHFNRSEADISFLIYDRAHQRKIKRKKSELKLSTQRRGKKNNVRWDLDKLRELFDNNVPMPEIAAALGMAQMHLLRCLMYRLRKEQPGVWERREIDIAASASKGHSKALDKLIRQKDADAIKMEQ